MKPREALRLSILTTMVLWLTGFVVVPFSNAGAREVLTAVGFTGPNFEWWSSQLENLAYTIGRVPLMFAAYIAFSGPCNLHRRANVWVHGLMVSGALVTILFSGWVQMAGFVCVVSCLVVRLAHVIAHKSEVSNG